MNRRRFLANLGLASAALLLRFRPESVRDVREVYSDEFGKYSYTVTRAWTPRHPQFGVPVLQLGLPAQNYFGHIEWHQP